MQTPQQSVGTIAAEAIELLNYELALISELVAKLPPEYRVELLQQLDEVERLLGQRGYRRSR